MRFVKMALCPAYLMPQALRQMWSPRDCQRTDPVFRYRRKHRWTPIIRHSIFYNKSQQGHLTETRDETEEDTHKEERVQGTDNYPMVEMEQAENPEPISWWEKIRGWFRLDMSQIQKLGIGAILSYGFLSNINSGICFTVAWLTHVKRTGVMPFAAGQWKSFLAVYAGLWAFYSVLRPLRIALAIALTPLVNRMMDYLVDKLGVQRKQAFFLLLFTLAVFTISSFAMAVWILGGIPTQPPPTTAASITVTMTKFPLQ